MNQEKIAELMHLPFPKLAEVCKDPETLATVISLAINMGMQRGREQRDRYYNQMFRGYDENTN